MVKTSWIYTLRKEELISYLESFKITTEGTVEELRKRLIGFCQKASPEEAKYLEELSLKHAPESTDAQPNNKNKAEDKGSDPKLESIDSPDQTQEESTTRTKPTNMHTTDSENSYDRADTTAIDKIRKWSVRYDGGKGPLPFVERVEELSEAYHIPIDLLPRAMPELLKDKALTWYRSNNKRWTSWMLFKEDFLKFFLPARYFENLEDTIRQRLQQPRESFRDYVLALQELMHHSSYTDDQKLHRLYRNCRQEYQLHIKKREFNTLDELMLLAGDYEAIKQPANLESNANSRPHVERSRICQTDIREIPVKNKLNHIDTVNACRRCGQRGHFARGCRNQQRLFCWTCGKVNTRTMDCCGTASGNATRTHVERGQVSQQNLTPHTQ